MAGTVSQRAPDGQAAPAPARRWALLLLAVLALALASRAWRLGLPALTSDEAFSWRLAGYAPADMLSRAAQDVHPPLFYLLLKAWTAAAGASVESLRGLSVLLGVAAVAVAAAAVLEAARHGPVPLARAGALLAALLMALHPLQVQQGRNARMYALGLLLAAATSWLLLRALRGRGWGWWIGYGAAAGAFAYTHYYALFTLASQGLAALWLAGPPAAGRDAAAQGRRAVAVRLALAAGVALLLLLPWLPALLAQVRQVQEEYWIPAPTLLSVEAALQRWATGLAPGPLGRAALAAHLLAAAFVSWRAPRIVHFFLLQAALPWAFALGVSALSGRPLFLERFTVFASVALACFWGTAWPRLRPRARAAVALLLAAPVLAGLAGELRQRPARPPALEQVARHLRRLIEPGDVVVADSPRLLNKVLFYTQRLGLDGLPARSLPGLAGAGHYTHHASLRPGELLERLEREEQAPRLWLVTERPHPVPPAPEGRRIGYARILEGGDGARYLLVRYERAARGMIDTP